MLTQWKIEAQLPKRAILESVLASTMATQHSSNRTFLTAEWRYLAMLNYEVAPDLLRNRVPVGTELDTWNERSFISLVGFRFLKTGVLGIRFPFHRDFDEVNLRFYVRRHCEGAVRRGVVFIREIVPRWAIAAIARSFYNERYVALPMKHNIQHDDSGTTIQYQWKIRKSWNTLRLVAKGTPRIPEFGSQEEFITEHYWGYAAQRGGDCIEYQVQHPQWKVWKATDACFDGCMRDFYGADLSAVLTQPPASAFLAEGSAVSVHRGRRL
jgi:uncharacterized protein YqjF (DUF2071 family)